MRPDPIRWVQPEPAYAGMVPLPLDPADLPAPPPPPTTGGTDPELDRFVANLVRALLDTISGRRAATQLTRWVDDEVYADLILRARLHQREPVPLALRTFRTQRVAADALEVCARVQAGPRYTAVALRLERLGNRWVCRVAEFGPLSTTRVDPLPSLRERNGVRRPTVAQRDARL
jgi:hypothetical protein